MSIEQIQQWSKVAGFIAFLYFVTKCAILGYLKEDDKADSAFTHALLILILLSL